VFPAPSVACASAAIFAERLFRSAERPAFVSAIATVARPGLAKPFVERAIVTVFLPLRIVAASCTLPDSLVVTCTRSRRSFFTRDSFVSTIRSETPGGWVSPWGGGEGAPAPVTTSVAFMNG
jgi:hypothetical protein